ncbi:Solute carrier family 35 member [Fasciola gigantica]|uniref:Solute carrier family 35 member n=1 Tax=Fasciola gigantica TaxID=46835 RepID=A0A504Y5E9_FASGI|nr:Solute carrier family 35 member [Fasciola gigantica]
MLPSKSDRLWNLTPLPDKFSWSFIEVESERLSEAEEELNPQPDSLSSRLKILIQIGIPLLLGQLLATLIAVTAICSAFLVQKDVSLPLSQNLFHYCVLCICYFAALGVRSFWRSYHHHRERTVSHIPNESSSLNCSRLKRMGLYALAGLIDTHANWAFVAAYSFTSVTSVQLLDCLTIPTAMLLSIFFLRHRFMCTHYVAMVICLLGAGGMVAADVLANPSTDSWNVTDSNAGIQSNTSRIILGDLLVILGAIAYAASNVLQQYLVIRYGIVNFLAYAGISATVPTAIYAIIFERDGLQHLFTVVPKSSSFAVVFQCLAGYVASMFLLYSLMPYVLAKTNAVLVNMSLLTADVYALLMGIFLFHYRFHLLYILCFFVILLGVGLFSYRIPETRTNPVLCFSRFRDWFCPTQHPEIVDPSSGELAAPSPSDENDLSKPVNLTVA